MIYKNLIKIKIISIIIGVSIITYFLYDNFIGKIIDEKTAVLVCGKIINDYSDQNFIIIGHDYKNFFNITDIRVGLNIKYLNNNLTTSADCIIKRNIKFNKVNIREALIINKENKLNIYENIMIVIKK